MYVSGQESWPSKRKQSVNWSSIAWNLESVVWREESCFICGVSRGPAAEGTYSDDGEPWRHFVQTANRIGAVQLLWTSPLRCKRYLRCLNSMCLTYFSDAEAACLASYLCTCVTASVCLRCVSRVSCVSRSCVSLRAIFDKLFEHALPLAYHEDIAARHKGQVKLSHVDCCPNLVGTLEFNSSWAGCLVVHKSSSCICLAWARRITASYVICRIHT